MNERVAEPKTGWRRLGRTHVVEHLARRPALAARLGGAPADWRVRDVADGNLNDVFLVDGTEGGVCVKQALPFVRVVGEAWPLPLDRAHFEHALATTLRAHVAGLVPEVYDFDPVLHVSVMEKLEPHAVLRGASIDGADHPHAARAVGDFAARAGFAPSAEAVPFERRAADIALFAGNTALQRITVDLVFLEPWTDHPRNGPIAPELGPVVARLRGDPEIRLSVADARRRYLTSTEALLHGDLHTGSVMVTADDARVIDGEFAGFGPLGFDLGQFLGNLAIAWFAAPGHARDGDDLAARRDRSERDIRAFWTAFRDRFDTLWRGASAGDALPASHFPERADDRLRDRVFVERIAAIFADAVVYAAVEIVRRTIGFARVADFTRIADARDRTAAEAVALDFAARILAAPRDVATLDDLLAALHSSEPQSAVPRPRPSIPADRTASP